MIRRARPEDSDAIAALFRRSFGTLTFLPTLHRPDEDRAFFGRLVEDAEVWVAEEDGRLLGFAGLSDDLLGFLYVDPSDHARGVGSALFDRVKLERPGGFELWVFQENTNARGFYERRGCRLVRLRDGSRNEERTPDALYEWRG
jgi:ribosomal protein S18 acetylase RimI-like enzyme